MKQASVNSPARGRAAALLAASALTTASAQAIGLPCSYDFTVVPPPPGAFSSVGLYDINNAGLAVRAYSIGLDPKPCTWTEAGDLKPLPMPDGVLYGKAERVNNNGWILVNAETTANTRGFVLIPSGEDTWLWVPMVPASAPGVSNAIGLNDKNEVVGYQSMGTPGGDPVYPLGGFR